MDIVKRATLSGTVRIILNSYIYALFINEKYFSDISSFKV